jgi:hypothetical protein
LANGRTDESTGAVPIKGVHGEALANAFLKAETKAKRRVTLSICGLGLLDETELETIPRDSFGKLRSEVQLRQDAPDEYDALLKAIAVAETEDHIRVLKPRIGKLSGSQREDVIAAATERIEDIKRDQEMARMPRPETREQ